MLVIRQFNKHILREFIKKDLSSKTTKLLININNLQILRIFTKVSPKSENGLNNIDRRFNSFTTDRQFNYDTICNKKQARFDKSFARNRATVRR